MWKAWSYLKSIIFMNSLAPGYVIFKGAVVIIFMSISSDVVLRLIIQDLAYENKSLVQVMAWCQKAFKHILTDIETA